MTVVIVTGTAGVGKSTVGRALARELRVPLLDLDTLTNPLLERLDFGGQHWNDPALRPVVRPARYAALTAVIAEQTALGIDAVAIAPFTAELQGGAEWEALSVAAGGDVRVVWLYASAEVLAARRATRSADRDVHIVEQVQPPVVPHLALDAAAEVTALVAAVRNSLGE